MLVLTLLPMLVAASAANETTGGGAIAPSAMTNASIAEHNATLLPTDPAFIRCRRIAIPGSLVKKARVCKSNTDWAKAWQVGNQDARDTYDAMNRGSSNSVEFKDDIIKTAPRPN